MISKMLNLSISKYFIISCLAGILDIYLSSVLYNAMKFNYILACNAGIISGFAFQYYTGINLVFKTRKTFFSFAVYLLTFIFGIAMANTAVFISFNIFKIPFLYSKLISMGVPFFITYFIRRALL